MRTATLKFLAAGLFAVGMAEAQSAVMQYSYILNPTGNQTPVANGGTLTFLPTVIGDTATATFIVANSGGGQADFTAVTIAGDGFRASALPLLPTTILEGRDARFTISFTPAARATYSGTLRLAINGVQITINLSGAGSGPQFTYQTIVNEVITDVPPQGPIKIADTNIGSTRTVRVRITNVGDTGRITTILASGPTNTYAISDLPILPVTLPSGASLEIALAFSPRETGVQRGTLRIDSTLIPIEATGIGAILRYTADSGTGGVPVEVNGTINAPNTAVGGKANIRVLIENIGNADITLSVIAVSATGFALTGTSSPTPVRLSPRGSVTVEIAFVPEMTGVQTGSLQVDDSRFTLRGTATAPAPIPTVTIGTTDSIQPLQQPAITIRLDAPYSIAITGRLTLTFSSETFADDGNIQFQTGVRTADFRIPENTTEAIFVNDGNRQILYQAGTVAGTITFTAALSVLQASVTPNPAPTKAVVMAPAAPQLTGVQVANRSNSGFDLLVTGYATPRSVQSMKFSFTQVSGTNLQTPTIDQNVDAPFTSWYQGTASRQFGSQFLVTVRFQGTGDLTILQSVSVTATNSRGTSPPVTATLR